MGRRSPKAPENALSEVGVGTRLGQYEVQALIGEGGMGRVYRARHLALNRTVALKVLHPKHTGRPEIARRFLREARVLTKLAHENIVQVTDLLEESGRACFVMEYLEGESLEAVLRRDALPVARAVSILGQVCDALAAAHEHGVVHRDLKPDNVFLVKRGEHEVVKVLDFGLAKLLEPRPGTAVTAEGMIVGTPSYMSPEQASGFPVGRPSDVWAVGVILYRALSGKLPFEAPTFVALLHRLTQDGPPPLPRRTPGGEPIPPVLEKVVLACLARAPKRRPSMEHLCRTLQPAATPPGTRRRRRRSSGRRVGRLLAIAAVAALAAFAVWLLRQPAEDPVVPAHKSAHPKRGV